MSSDEEGKKQADFVACHREVHAVGLKNRSEVYPQGEGDKRGTTVTFTWDSG